MFTKFNVTLWLMYSLFQDFLEPPQLSPCFRATETRL